MLQHIGRLVHCRKVSSLDLRYRDIWAVSASASNQQRDMYSHANDGFHPAGIGHRLLFTQTYRKQQYLQSRTGCLQCPQGHPRSGQAPRGEPDPAAPSWLLPAGMPQRGTGQHHTLPDAPFIQQQCLWCPVLHVMPADLINLSISL